MLPRELKLSDRFVLAAKTAANGRNLGQVVGAVVHTGSATSGWVSVTPRHQWMGEFLLDLTVVGDHDNAPG